jgi:hypothetical protein
MLNIALLGLLLLALVTCSALLRPGARLTIALVGASRTILALALTGSGATLIALLLAGLTTLLLLLLLLLVAFVRSIPLLSHVCPPC